MTKKCYYSNTSKAILFDFYSSVYSFSSESENSSLDPWTGKLIRKNSNASDNTESSDRTGDKNNTFKNITLAREDDSDISDTNHLQGYFGNVRRHPNHVQLPNGLSHKNKIILGKGYLSFVKNVHYIQGASGVLNPSPKIFSLAKNDWG